jgi:hypothetical protein
MIYAISPAAKRVYDSHKLTKLPEPGLLADYGLVNCDGVITLENETVTYMRGYPIINSINGVEIPIRFEEPK